MSIERIPDWVKEHAHLRGCLAWLSQGDPVVIGIASENAAEPTLSKWFARRAYDQNPDDCWREVLAEDVAPILEAG